MDLRAGADGTLTVDAALVLAGVRHTFGRTIALDDARCRVRRGSVHALLGENGAGKTTLMRVAFGLLAPDAGRIEVDGRPVRFRSSADAIAAGIGMVHQHFLLVPSLTAAENVALGGRGLLHLPRVESGLLELSARSGLAIDPRGRPQQLGVSAQQRLEILRALANRSRLLILDEPTAVLTPDEAAALLAWVRQFAAEGGTAILITHKLREALAVADDVTVMRRGRTVLERPASELDESTLVAAITAGAAGGTGPARPTAPPNGGAVVLGLSAAGYRDALGIERVREASLEIRSGEVVGVAAVEGAGQRELLRLLAGRLHPTHGRAYLPGRVGFVPEDRLADALAPEMSLVENLALADAGALRGRIPWEALEQRTLELLQRADVRAAGPRAEVRTLSGGNQQKFVVARERALAGSALVLENPTRGLDVVASARVLEDLVGAAREQGLAVVVHSPDLDEVLGVADRVIVCFEGRVREIGTGAARAERQAVARAMMGAA